MRLEGRAVKSFEHSLTHEPLYQPLKSQTLTKYHLENKALSRQKFTFLWKNLGSKPDYKGQIGKTVYQKYQATDYVYNTTPYLIIDHDLTESIKNAAMRSPVSWLLSFG